MALLDSTSFYYNGSDLNMFGMRIGWFDGADNEELAVSRDVWYVHPRINTERFIIL